MEKPVKLVYTPPFPPWNWRSMTRTSRINNGDFRKNGTIIIDLAMQWRKLY